jgi:two-component system sensor histidine kinase HydH
VERIAGKAGWNVRLAPGEWPAVRGDERLLEIAIAELLRNAVHASAGTAAAAPLVSVLPLDGQRVELAVRDWGKGLPSTNPKVLIRLQQSSKPHQGGVGLLAVERIARLHEGALRFEAPEQGAVVKLVLPAAGP